MKPSFRLMPDPEPAEGIASNGLPRESVWGYPRPPRIERLQRRVRVALGGVTIVDEPSALRVLETAGAPTVYVPLGAVRAGTLRPTADGSFCEWKGTASYFDVVAGGEVAPRAAWAYPEPNPAFAILRDHISFYPALLECRLDEEPVEPQPGGFYGGWVTAEITGPIKGGPGTAGW
jgi:uncharacterized protein (DUF427 family)